MEGPARPKAILGPSVYLAVFFLHSFDVASSAATECTLLGFDNMQVPKPTYLYVPEKYLPPSGKVESGSKITLRCVNGDFLEIPTTANASKVENGYLAGTGEFQVSCAYDEWVMPAHGWPEAQHCVAAVDCDLTNATATPTHLTRAESSLTNLPSGESAEYTCSDNKQLKLEFLPYERLCYNGTLEESVKGADLPQKEDCVENPSNCPADQSSVTNLGFPSHMEATGAAQTHGAMLEFTCTEGRRIKGDYDDKIVVSCSDGIVSPPLKWPSQSDCVATCDSLTVDASHNFDAINYTEPYLDQGETFKIKCPNNTYLSTDWSADSVDLTCGADGAFEKPSPFPNCEQRPTCQNHTEIELPIASRLVQPPIDGLVGVTEDVEYFCEDSALVMTHGASVKIPCVQDAPGDAPEFKFPAEWGGSLMQCREPVPCLADFPVPPYHSGLVASTPEGTDIREWSSVTYNCSDPLKKVYLEGVMVPESKFEVKCVPPGYWDSGFTWAYCDVADPPKCDDFGFESALAAKGISIMERQNVILGGKVYYQCDDPYMVTTLGKKAAVTCKKDTDDTDEDGDAEEVYFDASRALALPGWKDIKCVPGVYPSFKEPECNCLGDTHIGPEKSLQILREVCRDRHRTFADSKIVPFKDRCGVTDLNNIVEDNMCLCSEQNDNGVDFSVWTLGQVLTYDWHANFSEPTTDEFLRFQSEVQAEVDKIIYRGHPKLNSWRFIQTVAVTFMPGDAKACSAAAIPVPDEDLDGLELIGDPTWKDFGEYIEYECKLPEAETLGVNVSMPERKLTSDGLTYKLMCRDDGRFQNKPWFDCRERNTCLKPPARPPTYTGLDFSESVGVREFDEAVYKCKPGFDVVKNVAVKRVVPGTNDGFFRTPCQKSANFKQSVAIKWPTCIPMPANDTVCTDIPVQDNGTYVKVTPDLLYLNVGEKVGFRCADKSKMIGDDWTATYSCGYEPSGTEATLIGWTGSLPACRDQIQCYPDSLPTPDPSSGIEMPIRTALIEETDYIEYMCEKPGWSLLGDYKMPEQFDGDMVAVVYGRMRMYCAKDNSGVVGLGTVRKWPQCRDPAITHCEEATDYSAHSLEPAKPGPIPVAGKYTLTCSDPTQVTSHFNTLDIVCGYDGNFIAPDVNVTNCHAPAACPDSPTPTNGTHLVKILPTSPINEFMPQKYQCTPGYTLSGVSNPLVVDGLAVLNCHLIDDGNGNKVWDLPNAWPSCLAVKPTCNVPPLLDGFHTEDEVPVNVGETMHFKCNDESQVTDVGAVLEYTCTDSGLFTVPQTLPACRDKRACEVPPTPNLGITHLLPSNTTGVMEYETAKYSCEEGTALYGNASGQFELQCGFGGKYPANPDWVVCDITHCLNVTDQIGYQPISAQVVPVPVGDMVPYNCDDSTKIPGDNQPPYEVECLNTGEMDYPFSFPTCRAKLACDAAYPAPPASQYLLNTTSAGLKEFEYAVYSCKPGANLEHETSTDVVNGKFRVQCGLNGVWPSSITWPTCDVDYCVATGNEPFIAGFNKDIGQASNVAVADTLVYRCATAGEVLPNPDGGQNGKLVVECQSDGEFAIPSVGAEPTCRASTACTPSAPPSPTNGAETSPHFLKDSTDSNVKEYDTAKYKCKEGAIFDPNDAGVSYIASEYVFEVPCEEGASWPGSITWPNCIVERCMGTSQPSITNFTSTDNGNVKVGEKVNYQCNVNTHPGQVIDLGKFLELECGTDGEFIQPTLDSSTACRPPGLCLGPVPIPFSDRFLQDHTPADKNVTEFETIAYECKEGSKPLDTPDGKFHLQCPNGAVWPSMASSDWPECEVHYCMIIADLDNARTDDPSPLPGQDKVQIDYHGVYSCPVGQVIKDVGIELLLKCNFGGQFEPDGTPVCEDQGYCLDSGHPEPPAESHLVKPEDGRITEYKYKSYACESGYSLWPIRQTTSGTPNDIWDGKFHVQCTGHAAHSSWPVAADVTWPTCIKKQCDDVPTEAGFINLTSGPVTFGDYAVYRCEHENQVVDGIGKTFSIACTGDGTFGTPTWPTCKDPAKDVATSGHEKPEGPYLNDDLNMDNPDQFTVVTEFDYAEYVCKPDKFFGNMESVFRLQYTGSGYDDSLLPRCTLPSCSVNVQSLPEGWNVDEADPAQGETVTFSCNETLVSDIGTTFTATCDDGAITLPSPFPKCRQPHSGCEAPPQPDDDALNLMHTTSTATKEGDELHYACQPGYAIDRSNPDLAGSDGTSFVLTCDKDGKFRSPLNWPTCQPYCKQELLAPASTQLTAVNVNPGETNVRYGDKQEYKCLDTRYALPDGSAKFDSVQCKANGVLELDSGVSFPSCQPYIRCPFAPASSPGSNWILNSALPAVENSKIKYRCATGFSWSPAQGQAIPEGFNNASKMFELMCQSDGTFKVHDHLAVNGWPTCVLSTSVGRRRRSAERKKRWIEFPAAQKDIDYAIIVLLEAQFKWTPQIEAEIQSEYGIGKDHVNFSRALVQEFHDDFYQALGDGKVKHGFHLSTNPRFEPSCEQPTNANLDDVTGECVKSFVSATCPRETLEAAWLRQMGYTHKKQPPKWSNETAVEYDVPIGSQVAFYCSNAIKRPKRDNWDGMPEDGLITGHCTHGMSMNLTMNPALWDKCRSRCPEAKPDPPVVPGAQLKLSMSDDKLDGIIWEDDSITYGCDNDTLVINNMKGLKSKSYLCLESGAYETPNGQDVPWPVCTTNPTDPYIMTAIKLLTDEYDRNIVYRQQLKSTFLGFEVSAELNYFMTIAFPCAGALLAIVFLVMCCSRPNSPICKIFEPKA